MESSGACNLKEVGSEAAIAAPIIKLLWSPVREEGGGRREGGSGEGRGEWMTGLPLLFLKWLVQAELSKHLNR